MEINIERSPQHLNTVQAGLELGTSRTRERCLTARPQLHFRKVAVMALDSGLYGGSVCAKRDPIYPISFLPKLFCYPNFFVTQISFSQIFFLLPKLLLFFFFAKFFYLFR